MRLRAALLLAVVGAVGVAGTGGAVWAVDGLPIGEAPGPADKAASAVVDPIERAEHDAILDLPLKDEIQSVEQSLFRLGVLAEFPDVLGATEIDQEAARFLVFYNENAAPDRVAGFLQRVDAVDAPAGLAVVTVAAGHATAERQPLVRALLMQGGRPGRRTRCLEDHRRRDRSPHRTDPHPHLRQNCWSHGDDRRGVHPTRWSHRPGDHRVHLT